MEVTIALVGCGRWGSQHLRTLQELKSEQRIHRIVVCEIDEHVRRHILADAKYAGIEDALAHETIDAVAIVTPPESHEALIRLVLRNQLPAIVEKPLTARYQDSLQLLQEFRTSDHLLVGFLLRYHPGIQHLHRLINEVSAGRIEHLAYVRKTLRAKPKNADPLHELAIHGLDLVAWLTDSTLLSMQNLEYVKTPTSVLITLEHTRAGHSTIDVAWEAQEEVSMLHIETSILRASLDFRTGEFQSCRKATGVRESQVFVQQALREEWLFFLQTLQNHNHGVTPSIEELQDLTMWMQNAENKTETN